MPSRDIPREDWVTFLDSFSRQHERWLVNVEVVTDGLGAHREIREKSLIGVSADLKAAGRTLFRSSPATGPMIT